MNKICCIIPMYGKPEYTDKCVSETIKNSGIPVDILVVDDGSKIPYANSSALLILRLDKNMGFTNAANQGILWAQKRNYDYVHLLNNDTLPKENFIKILYDFLEETKVVGIAASARIHQTDSPHNIELFGADLISGYQQCTDGNIPETVFFTYWVPLCSALIRMDMIREIGILDKRMRTWSSDNDYCIRANFNGWNVALLIKSKVFHVHQGTTGKAINEGVKHDQMVLLEKMTVQYAQLMTKLPLDKGSETWGKLEFSTYKK